MAVYLSLTVIVLLMALLVKQTDKDGGSIRIYQGMSRQQMVNHVTCLIIFVLLFAVSSLRLNVGNDYLNYVELMHLAYSRAYVPTEVGFNVLARVIYFLCGFENYVLIFAIFAFATIYFFMKAMYEQSKWFTMSIVMFMLLGYYFQSLSTVRYYLALSIALYSVKYVINRDWPRFVLVTLMGSLFHKSLLLVLLLYIVAQLNWKRWMYVGFGILGVSCLFLKDYYLKIVIMLYPSYKDTEYLEGGTSIVNIVRCVVILALSLWLYKDAIRDSRRNRFYFICNIMALVLYVFGSFIPVISRVGYYMTVTHLLFVPSLIMEIKDDTRKKALTACTIIACVMYFALYMRGAANDGIRILPYQTFLFHDLPLTLSERGYY
ncbi:polysaccharide biosynthesis protein [Butyrivibrio proteoclasticus B316]|uniref:Polysaccharide biosynthesis protein n=1 Tax=Butyrivibrio proteoclasticus (strain ATCC 51982 / DSM 14932 / B316) TaxID=515622 RepID=E0RX92_BUTPB|nr:EpsG family protein [Butyrivibrio proteoclasticus]ADL35303.1 polysaccharide biosynthesis protein [Butyrivibrio proteoclasticus B316]